MGPLTSIFGILEAYITFVERKSNPLAVVGRRLTANSQQLTDYSSRVFLFVRLVVFVVNRLTDVTASVDHCGDGRKVTKVSEKRTWGSREGAKTQRKKKKVGGWQLAVVGEQPRSLLPASIIVGMAEK